MCLSRVVTKTVFNSYVKSNSEDIKLVNQNCYVGYKIMWVSRKGKVKPAQQSFVKYYKPGTKLYEEDYAVSYSDKITSSAGVRYKRGFHSFLTLEDTVKYIRSYFPGERSKEFKIVKVHIPISSIVAYGVQDYAYVVVHKKMTIPHQNPISLKTGLPMSQEI